MKKLSYIILMIFVLVTCRPLTESDSDTLAQSGNYDFSAIFEVFWQGMNRNYVYWSEEPSSLWDPLLNQLPKEDKEFILKYPESFWTQIYDVYKPRFEALGAFPGTTSPGYAEAAEIAYGYFFEMTLGLRDGHFRIDFDSTALPAGLPPQLFPGQNNIMAHYFSQNPPGAESVFYRSDLSGNTDVRSFPATAESMDLTRLDSYFFSTYNFVDRNLARYLAPSFDVVNKRMYGGMAPNLKLVRGKIPYSGGGDILYLFFNYCFLRDFGASGLSGGDAAQANALIDKFFAGLDDPNLKGVIIDVRGNTGGDPADTGYLWGRMIEAPLTYAHARSKSGEGRLDYTPWMPVRILPVPDGEKRLKNTDASIVLLVNKGTASGAEFMTMVVKSMPNGTVVGETTSGACSNTVDIIKYNMGAVTTLFGNGSFWAQVSGAVAQYKINGEIYEGFGIPPDVPVPMTRVDWENFYGSAKKDKQMEAAIRIIDPGYSFSPGS